MFHTFHVLSYFECADRIQLREYDNQDRIKNDDESMYRFTVVKFDKRSLKQFRKLLISDL